MTSQPLTLPRLLAVDAATCAVMGAALVAAADPAGALTGIPPQLLFWAGLLLLPIAAFMAGVARMGTIPDWAVTVVLLGNAGWALLSIALPLAGVISPNLLGWVFLVGQAAVVVVLTLLERGAAPRAATV